VYGALSKEEGECSEVKFPSCHLPILKEKCTKTSYIAIKKSALQEATRYYLLFLVLFSLLLKESNFLCVFFYVLAVARNFA
jgi:hypothetical protein